MNEGDFRLRRVINGSSKDCLKEQKGTSNGVWTGKVGDVKRAVPKIDGLWDDLRHNLETIC